MESKENIGELFENRVALTIQALGYELINRRTMIDGREIDILAKKVLDGIIPITIAIECKHVQDRNLHIGNIQDQLAGLKSLILNNRIDCALIVTTKGFSGNITNNIGTFNIQTTTLSQLETQLFDLKRYLEKVKRQFESEQSSRYYVNLRVSSGESLDSYVGKWLERDDSNTLAILGEYGTGKSLFCKKIAYDMTRQYSLNLLPSRIPLLVNLRDYTGNISSSEFIMNILQKKVGLNNITYDRFEAMNKAGLLLLIFDGFDEMAEVGSKTEEVRNCQIIEDLVTNNSKAILTCRVEFFRYHKHDNETLQRIDKKADVVYLQTFNDEQIKEYLRMRFGEPEDGQEGWEFYWDNFKNIFDLYDLARRPVLLDMISQDLRGIIERKERLGISRLRASDVYEFVIDEEITRKIKERSNPVLNVGERFEVIQKLADWMYSSNRTSIQTDEIEKVLDIESIIDSPKLPIKSYEHDFLTYSFLSKSNGEVYRFSHKSFQDYFIARGFVSDAAAKNVGNWGVRKLERREIIHFIGEIALKKQDAMNQILEWAFKAEDRVRYNTANAISCLDSTSVVNYIKGRQEELSKMSYNMLVWALGEIDYNNADEKKEIITILRKLLEHPKKRTWTWWMAAFAVGKLSPKYDPVEMLVEDVSRNPHDILTPNLCLQKIHKPLAVISIIYHDERYHDFFYKSLVTKMKDYIKCNKSWTLSHNLCWLAGYLKVAELEPELIYFAVKDENHTTRNIATEAIGKLRDLVTDDGYKAVINNLHIENESYYRTRYHAAEALGRINRRDAIPELKQALNKEYENIVRKEILKTLEILED